MHLFRFVYPDGRGVYWTEHVIAHGRVGTPMIAVHRSVAGDILWGNRQESDYWWIHDLTFGNPERAIWHEDVVVVVRPHESERGRAWLAHGYS